MRGFGVRAGGDFSTRVWGFYEGGLEQVDEHRDKDDNGEADLDDFAAAGFEGQVLLDLLELLHDLRLTAQGEGDLAGVDLPQNLFHLIAPSMHVSNTATPAQN